MNNRTICKNSVDIFAGVINPYRESCTVKCHFRCGLRVKRLDILSHLLTCPLGPSEDNPAPITFVPVLFPEERLKFKQEDDTRKPFFESVWPNECINCLFLLANPKECFCVIFKEIGQLDFPSVAKDLYVSEIIGEIESEDTITIGSSSDPIFESFWGPENLERSEVEIIPYLEELRTQGDLDFPLFSI